MTIARSAARQKKRATKPRKQWSGELEALAQQLDEFTKKVRAAGPFFYVEPTWVAEHALTHREAEVLKFVAGGLSDRQVAEKLFVTEKTVKMHLKSIFHKLAVNSRQELVARPDKQEVDQYLVLLGKLLRDTAEIATSISGRIPTGWSHYLSARRAFHSDAELAQTLGVDRSRIARWKRGEAPDRVNEERIRDLDIVVSLLSSLLEPEAVPDWLNGFNPYLGNRRPIDVLRMGRLSEVVAAIEARKSGAFA